MVKKRKSDSDVKAKPVSDGLQLSRQAFGRAKLGQSFAEHDLVRDNPSLFVETPAIRAAFDSGGLKSFFVGRRGTGKTAITFYLRNRRPKNTILLLPKLLSSSDAFVSAEWDERVHQKPFNTLVSSFYRAIVDEVVSEWKRQGMFSFRNADGSELTRERNYIEQYDFDLRLLSLVDEGFEYLQKGPAGNKDWIKFRNRPEKIMREIDAEYAEDARMQQVILIDRLDDEWNASNKAVILVMALMHACAEIRAATKVVQPLVFLRENVFDRVRSLDNEFSRLETSLVSLDWTRELLRELVERRLNDGLIRKFALGGNTWGMFFEGNREESESGVFGYCQYRPRDVLLYTSTALSIAQSHQHSQITHADLTEARRSFSENRLKELADEYADNYPQLKVVLTRFFGLGNEYTIGSIEDFIKKLLVDDEVRESCQEWIYSYTTPDSFIHLLYNIGFLGVRQSEAYIRYKSSEAEHSANLQVGSGATVVVHPSYVDGLQLQERVITALSEETVLRTSGLITEVPESFSPPTYRTRLQELMEELATLPATKDRASGFEDMVGEIIKLCFFRELSNVQPRVRNAGGLVIRDWIASNRAASGFWAIIRQKYDATQVIWECKNYGELSADDFHQASYYMNNRIGRFIIIVTRAQELFSSHTFEHVKRIASNNNGLVLLLRESDLKTFLRQALNGKRSEQHIQDIFDRTERLVS